MSFVVGLYVTHDAKNLAHNRAVQYEFSRNGRYFGYQKPS